MDGTQLDGWIPIRLYWREGQAQVDWCYLDGQRFQDSFFDQTIEECLRHPFNLLFRQQTTMATLGELHEMRPGLRPNGFIFHMSRSGSTLISKLLAALPANIVISEARPIDSTLRAPFYDAGVTEEQRIAWLRWMVSALAQPQVDNETHFFIKFDAWHILELPVIQRAFPNVPWVFVYRDPVEVLVSQLDHRGAHMVPGVIAPSLFGIEANTVTLIEPEEYCARVLAALCQAALEHHAKGGLLVNYRQLPELVWTSMSEFFGVNYPAAEREIMERAAKLDSKNPTMAFRDDSEGKRRKASARVREAANEWLNPIYEKLEAARLESQEGQPTIQKLQELDRG